jgi:serine protease Do
MLMNQQRAAPTVLVAAIASWASCRDGKSSGRRPDGELLANLAETSLPAVVRVRGVDTRASGAGFVVRGEHGDPLVVTAGHLAWIARSLTVDMFDGDSIPADLIGTDPEIDIAVLRFRGAATQRHFLRFRSHADIRVGEWVLSIGSPEGLLNAVSLGVIASRGRVPHPTLAAQEALDYLFTDAVSMPGNSGGPVLDLEGQIVGVNLAALGERGIGVVTPSRAVEKSVRCIEMQGGCHHGTLGISIGSRSTQNEEPPTIVTGCFAACRPDGLRAGDQILSVNGTAVLHARELQSRIFEELPGTRLLIEVRRDGQRLSLPLTIEELTQRAFAQRSMARPQQNGMGNVFGGDAVPSSP